MVVLEKKMGNETLYSAKIKHETCYLWDAWSFAEGDRWHLYCLALARTDSKGERIDHDDRNDHAFHIRTFVSHDRGRSWSDQGIFQRPGLCSSGADSANVWSGDAHRSADGKYWFAATGIRKRDREHPFVQSLVMGQSGNSTTFDGELHTLLAADTDYDQLRAMGYFLGPKNNLGHRDGELGGSILALRDPFIVAHGEQSEVFEVVFAAKTHNGEPAMGHVTVNVASGKPLLEVLHPPIRLPDADQFTQFEVPKIMWDASRSRYLLLASTADRIDEDQPEEEVKRHLRLYYAEGLNGPWQTATEHGSVILGTGTRFGATVLEFDDTRQELLCFAPLTTMGPFGGLYFDDPFRLNLAALGGPEPLIACLV